MSRHLSPMDLAVNNPSRVDVDKVMTNLEPIRFDASLVKAPEMKVEADWTTGLPVLQGRKMMLRELVKTDALSLL